MTDHNHEDYATSSTTICQACGKAWDICAYCNKTWHDCSVKVKGLLPGYRVIPEFPEYMVNKQASVRYIRTQKYCILVRVSSNGGAMINVLRDGKKYTRSAQELRDSAFAE